MKKLELFVTSFFSFNKNTKFYFWSLLLHCVLFFNIYFYKHETTLPIIETIIMPSFSEIKIENFTRKNVNKIIETPQKNSHQIEKSNITNKMISPQHVENLVLRHEESPLVKNKLLIMLHQAIQQTQVYPQSAIHLNREGTSTIRFTLSPNGIISNLMMMKSSGTDVLDQAAMRAVKTARYHDVILYLKYPEEFSVSVEFKL